MSMPERNPLSQEIQAMSDMLAGRAAVGTPAVVEATLCGWLRICAQRAAQLEQDAARNRLDAEAHRATAANAILAANARNVVRLSHRAPPIRPFHPASPDSVA